MTEPRWPLPPRAARVLYNAADAWHPPSGDAPPLDVVAALREPLRRPRLRQRVAWTLWLLEWSPRLALRSARGFSRWPRAQRQIWLARWEAKGPGWVRRALGELHELVHDAHASLRSGRAAQSLPGA